MLNRIDRSKRLLKWLSQLSDFLAKRRGLPIVMGVILILIGMVFQIIDVYVEARITALLGILGLNLGVLIALLGLLLVNPLGK